MRISDHTRHGVNRLMTAFSVQLIVLALTGLLLSVGIVMADKHEEDEGGKALQGEFADLMELVHSNFDENSINITNQWWPLTPGKQLIYEGTTTEDGERIPHRIVFTVTDLVKDIFGVKTVVIWDRDFSKGKLEESELAFFAQDKKGNVWHLGQYREMYDEVELSGGRAWMVGHLDGARAGIMMQANPQTGTPSYSQGYAPPPFNWTDRARVIQVGVENKVRYGNFNNVLVIEEYNAEEPDAIQLKYYAPGVGNIGVGWDGDDQNQEVLELVEVKQLSRKELDEVREEAMKLEKRNWIYGSTYPAEVRK